MGEPYEKCRKPLMDAYADCLEMMPDLLEWICSPVKAVEQVCYVAKVITVLCAIPAMIIDFVKVQVIDRIERGEWVCRFRCLNYNNNKSSFVQHMMIHCGVR
nr:uncharacterized protein LOC129385141 [Dermacentor andersoni]